MSGTSPCRFVSTDMPRIVKGRHVTACTDGECWGCQPCAETHCYGDACRGRNHALTICAECLTAARNDLGKIRVMCGMPLLEEVLSNGANSEAAMLLGPAANPEAWANRAMSALMGRVDAAYLEDCKDEAHPMWVLGTWEQVYRDHFDQPSDLRQTIARAGDYLSRQMHLMAELVEPPFDEFAKGLRQCVAHLEEVLSEGEQIERGAPCPACREADIEARPLVQVRNDKDVTGASDRWVCQRNQAHWWPEAGYRLRVADDYRANADALTAPDMAAEYNVPTGTVRGWATLRPGDAEPRVRKRGKDASGRQLYDVADVLAMRDKTRPQSESA